MARVNMQVKIYRAGIQPGRCAGDGPMGVRVQKNQRMLRAIVCLDQLPDTFIRLAAVMGYEQNQVGLPANQLIPRRVSGRVLEQDQIVRVLLFVYPVP